MLLPVQGHSDQAPEACACGQLPPPFLRPKEPLGFSALRDCRRGCHQPGPVPVPEQPLQPPGGEPQGTTRHHKEVPTACLKPCPPTIKRARAFPVLARLMQEGGKATSHKKGGIQQPHDPSPGCAKPQLFRRARREQRCWQSLMHLHKMQVQKQRAALSSLALASQDACTDQRHLSGCVCCTLALCSDMLWWLSPASITTLEAGQAVSLCCQTGISQPASSVPALCLHHQANTCPTTKPGLKHQLNPTQAGYFPLQP